MPSELGLLPGAHVKMGGENLLYKVVPDLPVCAPMHTQVNKIKLKKEKAKCVSSGRSDVL